jgi:hypothetical protein
LGKIERSVRTLLAVATAAVFLVAPVYGAPAAGLGTVVFAERANIGAAAASVGSTVFGGDRLITSPNGSLQVRVGAARFLLSSASYAVLLQEETSPAAILTAGSGIFSTGRANAFALHVFTAVIRPNSSDPTIGQVTVLAKNEMLVRSTRGALLCDVGGETRVIAEGEAYRVVIASEAVPSANVPGGNQGFNGAPRPPSKSKVIYYYAAAIAIPTFWALHEALESPDRP